MPMLAQLEAMARAAAAGRPARRPWLSAHVRAASRRAVAVRVRTRRAPWTSRSGPEDEALPARGRGGRSAGRPASCTAAPPTRRALGARARAAAGGSGSAGTSDGYGNRRATLTQQVVWAEEYARSGAPAAVRAHRREPAGAHAPRARDRRSRSAASCRRSPRGEELWCQGYSEPGAGPTSPGCGPRADARPGDGTYRSPGRRSGPRSPTRPTGASCWPAPSRGRSRHHGLSFLLVPMDQPGRVEVRPIRQMTGTSEFNEVFFDGARGARRARRRRRGQRLARRHEPARLRARRVHPRPADRVRRGVGARACGRPSRRGAADGSRRARAARAAVGRAADDALERPAHAGRFAGGRRGAERGQAAVGRLAPAARRAGRCRCGARRRRSGPCDWSRGRPYELDAAQHLFLFTRADTIYGGSDEIQRNIIAERVLGLPKEPR